MHHITASSPPSIDPALLAAFTAAIGPRPPDKSAHYREELDHLLSRVVPPVGGRSKVALAPPPGSTPPIRYGDYRFDVLEAMRERRIVIVGKRPHELYGLLERLSFHREPV